jgi:predicted regulator of Ras-like GTPase activity (Roadblock/LC7/MglB family)
MEEQVMTKKKKTILEEAETITKPAAVETASVNDLRSKLEEIKTYDGVIGYILRNSASASIDLKDPAKIIDYAILSSSALDAGEELSELFNLGELKDVVIEGEDVKMLSITDGENNVSVFLEKDADLDKVLNKLLSP